MSKGIKTVAKIALPIAASFIPGVGPLAAAAVGAGVGALDGGGLKGAVLGGITGYMSGGAAKSIIGTAAGAPISATIAGPTQGSGILGAVTGGGVRALAPTVTQAGNSILSNPSVLSIGNQLMAQSGANTADKAAKIQEEAARKAAATQAPYNQLGVNAVQQIQDIQADPTGYVQNNTFYNTLAADAQRRLLANQAAKGKLGSGGTAAALQEQLLTLGNGLVQQQVGTLQNQVNSGQTAASNVSNLQVAQGDSAAAGKVGAFNAINNGYQNQINTALALQGLNKAPVYNPNVINS